MDINLKTEFLFGCLILLVRIIFILRGLKRASISQDNKSK